MANDRISRRGDDTDTEKIIEDRNRDWKDIATIQVMPGGKQEDGRKDSP